MYIYTSKSARALQREKQIITPSASLLVATSFLYYHVSHDVHYTANVPSELGTNTKLHRLHGKTSERSRLRSRTHLHNLMLAPCVCVIRIYMVIVKYQSAKDTNNHQI